MMAGKRGCGFWVLVVGGSAAALLFWSSNQVERENAARVAGDFRSITEMSIEQYHQAWLNEPAARARFAAHRVAMSGIVSEVVINFSGKPVVRLEASDAAQSLTLHFTEA